jgi:hypothetical protein
VIDGFLEIFLALVPLAVVAGAGALMARFKVFPEAAIGGLSKAVVYVFLPALIFSKIVRGLNPDAMPHWWLIPLSALALFGLGLGLTLLLMGRQARTSRDVIPLGFMQNAGYFVLALGLQLHPAEENEFSAYVFLFVLGNSPLLWSFGKYFISRSEPGPIRWKELATPPLAANLLAVSMVLTGASSAIPASVFRGIEMAGAAAIPGALLVLGASLAQLQLRRDGEWGLVFRCVLIKLVLVPAATIGLLCLIGLKAHDALWAEMLVLQAAVPHAINLVIHVRTYGGNLARVGSVMVLSYLGSLVTIPFWLGLWQML